MRPEDQLVRHLHLALASVPNPFERLVYLATLRDVHTGRYLHEGWQTCSSPEEVHATVREAHRIAFEAVLDMPLAAVARNLRTHFQSLGETDESGVARRWLEMEPYREMIPEGSSRVSRKFFISQLRCALEVLLYAPQWRHLREPGAWPRQPLDQRPQLRSVN